MSSLYINSNTSIKGKVIIRGSKNASLPIIAASLLCKKVVLKNIPNIRDVKDMLKIFEYLNVKTKFKNNKATIIRKNMHYKSLAIDVCKEFRASYYLIPILLYLYGKCEIAYPGGCDIGKRPIDYHLNAIKEFGYNIIYNKDSLLITEECFKKKVIYSLPGKSVGATINAILLALRCDTAIIKNAVIEPEALDLINFLQKLGFMILHKGELLIIKSANIKSNIKYKVIPDRIEALSYVVLGLLCGNIKVKNIIIDHIRTPLEYLLGSGYYITLGKNSLNVHKTKGTAISFSTAIYPGIPTDIQPILGVLNSCSRGNCVVTETVFENRLKIYENIKEAGGDVSIVDNNAYINASDTSKYIYAKALDLRQGMALLILAVRNGGKINNYEIIERGYDDIYHKLKRLKIKFKIK